ncbi:hypothetical protein OESDEN_24921 [Oesophagostomum dentatum]|uniref:Uncharacterized protein n=1 Tax=Oesophagostomum dentatum TaxID=61180 RepID=A0A0B1RS47_OESDE|nr:hypothetical protein OESDEN_24921 [Oesophagostomum dentatum]
MKRLDDAKKVLYNLIENDSNNAMALAYYGYILKVAENNVEQGVAFMKKGLRLGPNEITDAKFYYHLGQGLMILGRSSEVCCINSFTNSVLTPLTVTILLKYTGHSVMSLNIHCC